jgi:hypothetical protein
MLLSGCSYERTIVLHCLNGGHYREKEEVADLWQFTNRQNMQWLVREHSLNCFLTMTFMPKIKDRREFDSDPSLSGLSKPVTLNNMNTTVL